MERRFEEFFLSRWVWTHAASKMREMLLVVLLLLLLLLPDGTDLCHLTTNEKGMSCQSVLNEGRYLERFFSFHKKRA